jgi:hypothetical protein
MRLSEPSILFRQLHISGERGALALLALDQEAAAVAVDDVLNDREAEAGPAALVAQFSLDPEEALA